MKSILYDPEKMKQQALRGYIRSEKMCAHELDKENFPVIFKLDTGWIEIKQDYKDDWAVFLSGEEIQTGFKGKKDAFDWVIQQIEGLKITIGLMYKEN